MTFWHLKIANKIKEKFPWRVHRQQQKHLATELIILIIITNTVHNKTKQNMIKKKNILIYSLQLEQFLSTYINIFFFFLSEAWILVEVEV